MRKGNSENKLHLINKKDVFQNCYFILDGKVETRIGKENMQIVKTK